MYISVNSVFSVCIAAEQYFVRQSAQMSKITNDDLTRSGTGCFIVVPIWQQWPSKGGLTVVMAVRERIDMGDKFTSSLSSAGELVLLIQDFSLADVGEYKAIVENEFGAVSQIVRMEMSGTYYSQAVYIIECAIVFTH